MLLVRHARAGRGREALSSLRAAYLEQLRGLLAQWLLSAAWRVMPRAEQRATFLNVQAIMRALKPDNIERPSVR